MEKLSNDTVAYLQRLIKTCLLCGIDMVALQAGLVRGQSTIAERGTFILETEDVPEFEFDGLGIGRVKTLGTRIGILDEGNLLVSFNPKEKDNGDIIAQKLQLTSNKTKIEFSCFDPMKIKSPKTFKDQFCYTFAISEDTLKIMSKALAAIDAKKISFSSEKDGTIKFRTADVEGDLFEHTVADSYEIDEHAAKPHFLYGYEIKYILPLFKATMNHNNKIEVNISERGVLKVVVNGFSIYIVPEGK